MDTQDKIELAKRNIWQAIDDYKARTWQTDTLDEITEDFVNRLAEDNTHAKEELRTLFRKSPVWNEDLDALVINGTRTHDPDYDRAYDLAEEILSPARLMTDSETNQKIALAIRYFMKPRYGKEERQEAIAAIKELAPDAYAPNKKPGRIFKALCDALKVSDDTAGSDFQRLYAQFADEISSRKIPFKLFVSLNPAHFLTMSNPKEDKRGDMLTSCHSLNSTHYEYNCGCTGYARDNYTFIVFTAKDPDDPETLNNRKNSRQIFAYKPGNGLLLQSRLYDANGGTRGTQEDSKLYRDLIQREISELEGAVNLWKTCDYVGNLLCKIEPGKGFGGYPDWQYEEFDAKLSIRSDHEFDFEPFEVGTSGLCICCGDETSYGLYCNSCRPDEEDDEDDDQEDYDEEDDDYDDEDDVDETTCDDCGTSCNEFIPVRNHDDEVIYVCETCRRENYTYCDECSEYYPTSDTTTVHGGRHACRRCLDEYYARCSRCGAYHREEDMTDGLCPNCAASAEGDAA